MKSDAESPVALVTNVSNRIAAAAALRLAASGARVIACDSSDQELPGSLSQGIDNKQTKIISADLAADGEAGRIVNLAIDAFGRVDVLVTGPAIPPAISWPDADRQLLPAGINGLRTWINSVEAAMDPLERSSGRIISLVTSAGRYRTGYFRPNSSEGSATPEALVNGAILGLIRQLALECAPKGVRLNAVVVGLMEGSDEFERMGDRERKFALEEISLGRLGTPEDVAGVVAFLASRASNYVTGTAIDVNGGWWMS